MKIVNLFSKMIASYKHTLAVIHNELRACGENSSGELGLAHKYNVYTFTKVDYDFGSDIKKIICDLKFTVILTTLGDVFVCGDNE